MILSFISVWLLVSFLQIWKENGIIWRAGLICALMKSISPSAFILGPMIGIMTEALLIELFVFILGKNLAGYMIGGAFAVLSTIIHKLISLLILYGFDFIKILTDLYQFALKQINIENLSPLYLVIVVIAVYILTGLIAAILGYNTGKKYSKISAAGAEENQITLQSDKMLFSRSEGEDYSLLLLFLSLFSIISILLLINSDYILPAIIAGSAYTIFCILKYRNSLKRLKKPSFWISFLVITFAATFLWDGFSNGVFFSMNGLITGLKMNARAIIIVIGFASISVELKNPVIKSVLYHKGFANLYQSLNLSFSALPYFISNLSKNGNNPVHKAGLKFQGILGQAETLYKVFELNLSQRPQVVIITGDVHEGKTSFAKEVISRLSANNIRIGGFLSQGINENGKRVGFNLYDIESGTEIELCSDKNDNKLINFGRYYFSNEALERGLKLLKTDNLAGKQLIVIDEIGPLELKGLGWSSAIETLCQNSSLPQLWVVRKNILKKIIRRWNIGNIYVFDIARCNIQEAEIKLNEIIFQSTK